MYVIFFFFSSRRRHTRFDCDWSSDVCSSDLPAARTLDMRFSGASGRWGMRRSVFRQGGTAHQLLVIADLSVALREEERQAWQRLVRVLGHELNNSLAPVRSIAESLEMLLKRDPRPEDWAED